MNALDHAELGRLRSTVTRLEQTVAAVQKLCQAYTPNPPTLFANPTSEHGKGYNAGTADLAQAVLGTIEDGLRGDSDG